MSILRSILLDVSTLAKFAAFVAWWVVVYLGIQLSRYRHEPEMPIHKRRWEVSMLVFIGLLAVSVAAKVMGH